MMFGLMFIEMESFNELKQASGYGLLSQKVLIVERWASREVVEDVLRAHVEVKKTEEMSRRRSFRMEKAMIVEARGEASLCFNVAEARMIFVS
jgi:hypothetical protein